MKIYFAGPLFNEAEKKFNQNLTEKIESVGFDVFLPQRDGIELSKSSGDLIKLDEKKREIFNLDRDKILDADIFLFVLDGREPDEGACVELGIAYTQKYIGNKKKKLIGFHTDSRAAFVGSKLNPMIEVPLDYITDNEEELIKLLRME